MTKKEQNIILIGLSIASFLGCVCFTIVNTALPAIQLKFDTSFTQLQWIINIFTIALTTFMVVIGRLADLKGHRTILYFGIFTFGVASLGAGFSPNIYTLIFFRFLQGISAAIFYVVPIAIINNQFSKKTLGKATGIILAANGLGLAMGPLLGGILINFLSWRWIFFINPPLILISYIILLGYLKESISKHPNHTLDIPGFIAISIAIPSFVLFILEGSSNGWFSSYSIILFCLTLLSTISFYVIEKKSDYPIIDFNLFINHRYIAALVGSFSLAFFYTLAFFLMPLYLHNIQEQNSFHIGLTLIPASAMVILIAPWIGSLTDRYGPKKILITGFIAFIISAYIQTTFSTHTHLYEALIAFSLMGIGWSCILNPSIVVGLSSLPEKDSAVGMGTIGTIHHFGGTVGLTIGTVIFHHFSLTKLTTLLSDLNISTGAWARQVVSDPNDAVQIIADNTALTYDHALVLFCHFFAHGYHAAFWMLLGISIIAIITIMFGIKKNKC